jgi:hypothetical protein
MSVLVGTCLMKRLENYLSMVTVFASWGGGLDPKGVLELLLGPWRWYTGWDVAQNGLLVDVQNGIG